LSAKYFEFALAFELVDENGKVVVLWTIRKDWRYTHISMTHPQSGNPRSPREV